MNPNDHGVPDDVDVLAERYRNQWADRSDWYWLGRLLQEVAELIGALTGIHSDSPERELAQIGSIAKNWLRHR